MKLTHTCSIVALSLASVAFAQQDGTFPPQGPGPGGRGDGQQGQQGERPRQPIDPQQFVDRMMQNDANGDGKLSKDELPPALVERLMERADTNKDGSIDRSDLEIGRLETFGALVEGSGDQCVDHVDQPKSRTVRKLLIFAINDIESGDELTIDYNWPASFAIPCNCKTPSCRGWIVSKKSLERLVPAAKTLS